MSEREILSYVKKAKNLVELIRLLRERLRVLKDKELVRRLQKRLIKLEQLMEQVRAAEKE